MPLSLSTVGRISGTVVLVLLVLCAIVLLLRWRMHAGFFYPDLPGERPVFSPADREIDFRSVTIPSGDGVSLHGWWVPSEGSRAAVVFLHGNAATIGTESRVRTVEMLHGWGYHVLSFDYRGYGASEGRPTHDGVLADARAAVSWTAARPEVERIALYGHSLGGALALCSASASGKVAGVATQGAFDSARGMVRHVIASLLGGPVADLLVARLFRSPIEPRDHLDSWDGPIFLMAGSDDYVVPPRMSRGLFQAIGPERADLWMQEGGLHVEAIDLTPRRYRARLRGFLAEALEDLPRPRATGRWEEGRLRVECRNAPSGSLDLEAYFWDGEGGEAWMELEADCPEAVVEIDPGFDPAGVALQAAHDPGHPTDAGRKMLERRRSSR